MFALLVTSCQQVWNKLLTTCSKLVDIVRLVTRLFQLGCYNHAITMLLQLCVVKLATFFILLYHDCIRVVRRTCNNYTCKNAQVVTSQFTSCPQVVFALLVPSLLQQDWNKLLTTRNKLDGIIRLVTRLFEQV